MSTARAQRFLLGRLSSSETVLLSLHLELPAVPDWADGADAAGRSVYLVNAHALRQLPEGDAAVTAVLAALREGYMPEGVVPVAYAPALSAAWAEVVMGDAEQVLVDGPRASGKTQGEPGMLAGLAERHARAGYPLPLRALWLHSAVVNAHAKTLPSLGQAHWGGLWSFRDDKSVAVLTVGGIELVHAPIVGTQDQTAQERARAECHVVLAEEVVPSLDESGGVEARIFDLARNSARLPTPHHVAVAVTNPGDIDTWCYRRFIEGGGQPGCVRCEVPASDRLTPEEAQRQIDDFADSPDLQARLGRGEWSALKLGECVAEGYAPTVHVAARRLEPTPEAVLAIGWDGGHSPSAVIGQLVGGQVRIYAALNDLKVGVLELIEDQVRPWLIQRAPWWQDAGALVHVIDPSMATGSEATIRASAERTIRDTLGGRVVRGPQAWSPRGEAVLRVLAPRHEDGVTPLAINAGPETALLRQACGSRWYYAHTADGRVDRSRPKKPNSHWADVGDACAYLLGWLRPGAARPKVGPHRARMDHRPLDYNRRPRPSIGFASARVPWPRSEDT